MINGHVIHHISWQVLSFSSLPNSYARRRFAISFVMSSAIIPSSNDSDWLSFFAASLHQQYHSIDSYNHSATTITIQISWIGRIQVSVCAPAPQNYHDEAILCYYFHSLATISANKRLCGTSYTNHTSPILLYHFPICPKTQAPSFESWKSTSVVPTRHCRYTTRRFPRCDYPTTTPCACYRLGCHCFLSVSKMCTPSWKMHFESQLFGQCYLYQYVQQSSRWNGMSNSMWQLIWKRCRGRIQQVCRQWHVVCSQKGRWWELSHSPF